MANNPFDRVVINPRERPLSADIDAESSQRDRTLRTVLSRVGGSALLPELGFSFGTSREAFIGDAFKVYAGSPPSLTLAIQAGLAFIPNPADVPSAVGGVVGVDDLSAYKPIFLASPRTVAVPAPAALPRNDIIEVRYDRRLEDPASRDVIDITTGAFVPTLVNKTLAWQLDTVPLTFNGSGPINYKTGTPAASPTAPTTTPGYVRIATVRVPALAASINQGNVRDVRRLWGVGNQLSVGVRFVQSAAGPIVSGFEIDAPPGVIAAVRQNGASTAELYVFAGDLTSTGNNVHKAATASIDDTVNFGALIHTSATVGLTSTAQRTDLANPLLTVPALVDGFGNPIITDMTDGGAPHGQPHIKVDLRAFKYVGAGPAWTSYVGADTYKVNVRVGWRYR